MEGSAIGITEWGPTYVTIDAPIEDAVLKHPLKCHIEWGKDVYSNMSAGS